MDITRTLALSYIKFLGELNLVGNLLATLIWNGTENVGCCMQTRRKK